MPSNFSSLDTGFPDLSGMNGTEQKLLAIQDYLVQLLEQLRYTLNNLGVENFNPTSLREITDPIHAEIEDEVNGLSTKIDVTAAGIETTVAAAQQTWKAPAGVTFTMYGYGEPTAPASEHDGAVYLDQSTGYYYTSNGTTWVRSGSPCPTIDSTLSSSISQNAAGITNLVNKTGVNSLGQSETLYSRIDQTADEIRHEVSQVTEVSPLNWQSGTSYAVGDKVKVVESGTGTYYICTTAHTASNSNKPGSSDDTWKTYWSYLPANNVLGSRITQNATSITNEVSRSGTGSLADGETLYSKIEQTAEDIKLGVKGNYAAEWASDHGVYYQYDVVKVTTTSGGQATAVQYYRASSQHTAAANNKPGTTGGGSYWVEILNPTTQAMIDLNLRGISLSYNNQMVGSSEWASGTSYLKDAVVSVTEGTVALYYKAKQNHTASASNKPGTPGGANYWDSTTEPNEHNASYILLNKDGVSIGGGKVFIKDLDADTIVAGSISADRISAGTLNADTMNMLGKFSVQEKDQNGVVHTCGTIGGSVTIPDPDDPSQNMYGVYIGAEDCFFSLEEHRIDIISSIWDEDTHSDDQCSIIITPNSIQMIKREYRNGVSTNSVQMEVLHNKIRIKKGTDNWIDLFDLEQRVTALENA